MCKVFIEYTIDHGKRADYLHYMHNLINQTGLELYEGSDQPGLFVEIWSNITYSEYEILKSNRLNPEPDSKWEALGDMLSGGLKKLHIWHFNQLEL